MAEHILILLLTALLMIAGLAGSVLPGIPGSPLILLGAFLYAWYTGFAQITWTTLLGLLILTLLSQFVDFFASVLGVKRRGGSRWGMAGALLGGIFGIFAGGIVGLILGTFLGAFFLEMIHTRNVEASWKSGVGTLIGFLFGTLGKLGIALLMIALFLFKIWV
jgi:hypothetical protein